MSVCYVLVAGFIFSAVSGYFAGLVGATNSPGSGLIVASLLILCLLTMLTLGTEIHFSYDSIQTLGAAALTITVCSLIGAALVLANETIQDLKAGQIVGATPWKQQVMLILGVIVSALVLPLILQLLYNAYGIGGVFPHPGMDPSQMLAAPQAALMAAVAQGVFTSQLPWGMVGIGVAVAVVCIIIDEVLKGYGTRLPVLAVGLGIYLPLESSTPIIIGGILSYIVQHKLHRKYGDLDHEGRVKVKQGLQSGLLLACGIVAGAALVGVLLAIPFALEQSADAWRLVPTSFEPIAQILIVVVTLALCYWIYHTVCRAKE
jgi:putative OPT family oligopeptide transporter